MASGPAGSPVDAPRHREARHLVARLRLDVGAAIPRARPETALDVFGGPFLAGDDAEWVVTERERKAARRLDALARSTDAQLHAGRMPLRGRP
jgi:hypothetical protein